MVGGPPPDLLAVKPKDGPSAIERLRKLRNPEPENPPPEPKKKVARKKTQTTTRSTRKTGRGGSIGD